MLVNPSEQSSPVNANDACMSIVNSLLCHRRGGENLNFSKKAIESLVKKLKEKPDELDNLIMAVTTNGTQIPGCVTIPRTLDGRLQIAGRKCFPHVIYARIWRWPNLHKNELRQNKCCEYGYEMKMDYVCINPYHYERVVASAVDISDLSLTSSIEDLDDSASPSIMDGDTSCDKMRYLPNYSSNDDQQRHHYPHHHHHHMSPRARMTLQYGVQQAATGTSTTSNGVHEGNSPENNNEGREKCNSMSDSSSSPIDMFKGGANGSGGGGGTGTGDRAGFSSVLNGNGTSNGGIAGEKFKVDHLASAMLAAGGGGGGGGDSGSNKDAQNNSNGSSNNNSSNSNSNGQQQQPQQQQNVTSQQQTTQQQNQPQQSSRSSMGGSNMNFSNSGSGTWNQGFDRPPTSSIPPMNALTHQKPPEFWCTIAYFELNQHVGEIFKVPSQFSVVTVDGYTDPSSPNRFCLGQLSNVHRSESSEKSRLYIGKGVELNNVGEGDVWIRCLSSHSVFVQSYYLDREAGRQPGDAVHKIYPGAYIKVFDIRQCHQQMRKASQEAQLAWVRQAAVVAGGSAAAAAAAVVGDGSSGSGQPGTSSNPLATIGGAAGIGVDDLSPFCVLRLSFVKGWGPDYPRHSIKETPCWIEIKLNRPMQLLDEVLQSMSVNEYKPTRHFFANYYNHSGGPCSGNMPN